MTNLAPIGDDLLEAARSHQDATIELRRSIHADPELRLQLPETQKKILESLTGLGLDITLGESTHRSWPILTPAGPAPPCYYAATWTHSRYRKIMSATSSHDTTVKCMPAATMPMWPCWPALPSCCARIRTN